MRPELARTFRRLRVRFLDSFVVYLLYTWCSIHTHTEIGCRFSILLAYCLMSTRGPSSFDFERFPFHFIQSEESRFEKESLFSGLNKRNKIKILSIVHCTVWTAVCSSRLVSHTWTTSPADTGNWQPSHLVILLFIILTLQAKPNQYFIYLFIFDYIYSTSCWCWWMFIPTSAISSRKSRHFFFASPFSILNKCPGVLDPQHDDKLAA